MNSPRGGGSLRERSPGVWEVRVALGADPVSGVCRQRSVTVRGDAPTAASELARWAGLAAVVRAARRSDPAIAVGQLLVVWLAAEHQWRPSTLVGYRSVVRALTADPIGRRRVATLSPVVLRAACTAWVAVGVGEATVWARVRVLRSAVRWAYTEPDRRFEHLGIAPLYGSPNPVAFMELQDVQELSNFFERRVSAYQVVQEGPSPSTRTSERGAASPFFAPDVGPAVGGS